MRRQREAWAREATQQLATGRTMEALSTYESQGAIVAGGNREEAQRRLLAAWSKDRHDSPDESRLILAYTRDDVRELNTRAREILKGEGKLLAGESVQTARGAREFAAGDRILFLRNEKSLGVKNGTVGTLEHTRDGVLQVRLDGPDQKRIAVETKDYQDLDYGYASTIHKSQGATVDRSYVLASKYFDRHTSYVALSRHRESAMLFYSEEEFGSRTLPGRADPVEAKRNLNATLARARPKELAHDFLELVPGAKEGAAAGRELRAENSLDNSPQAIQARAREAWAQIRAKQEHASPEEVQRLARERWKAYRQGQTAEPGAPAKDKSAEHTKERGYGQDDDHTP